MSENGFRGRVRSLLGSYVLLVAVAVVVGLVVAPFAFSAGTETTESVAVVPLAGSIDGANANDFNQRLVEARQDDSVAAVVVVINTGGGLATSSQEMYMQMSRTAEEKPVVAVVDSAALSGGYHAAVGADYIFAKPSSNVGSVGSILMPPGQLEPIDIVVATGPDKLTGDTQRGWEYQVATSSGAFAGAVMDERGEQLELSERELRQAGIYTGIDAVENGLVDEDGDITRAIQHAAEMGGIDDEEYSIETLQYSTPLQFTSQSAYLAADVPNKTLIEPTEFVDPSRNDAGPTILMMPPGAFDGEALTETEYRERNDPEGGDGDE